MFPDQISRKVKQLQQNGTKTILAVTGKEGKVNGSTYLAAFGQPLELCTEGGLSHRHSKTTLHLIIKFTVEFLANFGRLYLAFSVHSKNLSAKM